MKKKQMETNRVLTGLHKLAFGKVNDAVRLVFAEEVSPEMLSGMNLFNVSEIKRDKGGGVEMRFFDRQKALERLYEYAHAGQNSETAENLLKALTGTDENAV